MALLNPRELKNSARSALDRTSCDPRQVVLTYAGAMALLSLVLTALDYLLEQQISNTGGLSGLGTRSILSTAQSFLSVVQPVALLFWQMGYTYFVVQIAREQETGSHALAEGFRQFGPVLRLTALQALIYLAVGLICANLTSFLFMMTPWASDFLQTAAASLSDGGALTDTAALEAAIADAYLPIMGIFLILLLAGCAPIYYRIRLSPYYLMEHPRSGALAALRASRTMTKGSCLSLLKLDLSFWWFYLLSALVAIVSYGDLLAPVLGIELPWSDTVSYFVFCVLYLVLDLALALWQSNPVNVTYAKAYTVLESAEAPQPAAQRQNFPW